MRSCAPIIAMLVFCSACERTPAVESKPQTAAVVTAPPDTGALDEAPLPPWTFEGRLLGVTETSVLALTDHIVAVDRTTGEVTATATTGGEDPQPTFLNNLPRLGNAERSTVEVDRLEDMPVWVGPEVVVFSRGNDDAVTSLVGLDAASLEEAWTKEVSSRRPVRSCATDHGVVLVPPPPAPARAVDWLGQQSWLRELAVGDEKITDLACVADELVVRLEAGGKSRLVAYAGETGDLLGERPDSEEPLPSQAPSQSPDVRQEGDFIAGNPAAR